MKLILLESRINLSPHEIDASNKEEAKLIMGTLHTLYKYKGSVERDHRNGLMDAGCDPAVSLLLDKFRCSLLIILLYAVSSMVHCSPKQWRVAS